MNDKEYIVHIKRNSEHWENLYYTTKEIIQNQNLVIEKLENKIKYLQSKMQDN